VFDKIQKSVIKIKGERNFAWA